MAGGPLLQFWESALGNPALKDLKVRFAIVMVGNIAVVAFNFAHIFDSIDIANEVFDIAYELHLNTWNGREKLELRLLDLRGV